MALVRSLALALALSAADAFRPALRPSFRPPAMMAATLDKPVASSANKGMSKAQVDTFMADTKRDVDRIAAARTTSTASAPAAAPAPAPAGK